MAKQAYWVRLTARDGTQTLWCINTGFRRFAAVRKREQGKLKEGETLEWGKGENPDAGPPELAKLLSF